MSQPLRAEKPAAVSRRVSASIAGTICGARSGTLDSAAPVALDEGDDDVLAAETGQELIGRDAGEGVYAGLRANTARSRNPAST